MLLRPLDTAALQLDFKQARPFPHVVIDDFLEPDFALEVARSIPSFDQARPLGERFETVNEHKKIQVPDRSRFPAPVARLSDALHSEEWLEQLRAITAIPSLLIDDRLIGGGLHLTGRRGRLDVHADFNYLPDVHRFRRLNLLLYLNPAWKSSWGGELELWNENVSVCERSVEPLLGRCVIFETSTRSFHGTTRVRCPRDEARKSFALYYYSYEPPPGFNDDFQGTVFRARPDERLKGRVLMPLERAWHRTVWETKKACGALRSKLRGGQDE